MLKKIRNLKGTDRAELNQHFYCEGSSKSSDRLSFQVHIEKKQRPFTVTKMYIVHTRLFTYQRNKYDWITNTANPKTRCKDDENILLTKIVGQ